MSAWSAFLMPFLSLFTGIRHLALMLTVPPTKALRLCATPAGLDLYIQAMPVGTYQVQSPGFPKIVYSKASFSNYFFPKKKSLKMSADLLYPKKDLRNNKITCQSSSDRWNKTNLAYTKIQNIYCYFSPQKNLWMWMQICCTLRRTWETTKSPAKAPERDDCQAATGCWVFSDQLFWNMRSNSKPSLKIST